MGQFNQKLFQELSKEAPQIAIPKAKEYIDHFLQAKDIEMLYKVNLFIGKSYKSIGDFKTAISYLQQALDNEGELNNSLYKIDALNNLGLCYYRTGIYDESEQVLREAKELIRQLKPAKLHPNLQLKVENLSGLGSLYYMQGYYEQAYIFFIEAKNLNFAEKKDLSYIRNNIGLIYLQQEKFEDALTELFAAAEGLDHETDKLNLARIYNNISSAYQSVGQIDKAILNYTKALDLNRIIGSQYSVCVNLYNLADMYSDRDPQQSKELLEEAIELCQKLDYNFLLASSYSLMSTISLKFDQYKKSLEFLTKAEATFNKDQGPSLHMEVLLKKLELINFCIEKEIVSHKDSKVFGISKKDLLADIDEAILYTKKEKNFVSLSLYYQALNTYYAAHEQYKQAHDYLSKLFKLKIQSYKTEKANAIARLEIKHETNEKEQTIRLQKLKIEKRELELKQKKEIEEINKNLEKIVRNRTKELSEKNKRLQEFTFIVSHDLKEPIRNLVSFTQLLMKELKDKIEPQDQDYADFIIQSSTHIHHLLSDLLWYNSIEKNIIVEPSYLPNILESVKANLKLLLLENNVNINLDADFYITIAQDHMILLLKQLIQNAVQFRKNESCNINIYSRTEQQTFQLVFEDDGIGINPEYYEKIFKIFYRLDKSKSGQTGIGLAICRKVMILYNGKIFAEPVDEGTRIVVEFDQSLVTQPVVMG